MNKWLFTSLLACAAALPTLAQQRGGRLPQAEEKLTSQKIDGAWTVVYAESDGKKLADKSVTDVAIKDSLLRYKRDGKEVAWRLDFGPNHTVKAIDATGTQATQGTAEQPAVTTQMRVGVYIASPEYLCFALNRWTTDTKPPKGVGGSEEPSRLELLTADGAASQPPASVQDKSGPAGSGFVLILRR
jgi:hypothetical protein